MHEGVQTQLCCESNDEAPILVPNFLIVVVTIIKVATVLVLFLPNTFVLMFLWCLF